MMHWISVSLPVSEHMAVYKNLIEKRPVIETTRTFSSNGMHESTLHLPLHTGTHVDYPLHALPQGKCSSDYKRFPVQFSARIVDFADDPPENIGLAQVREIPMDGLDAVFFKTHNAPLEVFDSLFPWLTSEAASWLAQHPLLFVGIDHLGIERSQPGHETHLRLLSRDILIIEGLELSWIKSGIHQFTAFTLGILGVEAEPVMLYILPPA